MVPMLVDIWKNIWMNCDVWFRRDVHLLQMEALSNHAFFKHESSAVGAALYFVDKFIEEI